MCGGVWKNGIKLTLYLPVWGLIQPLTPKILPTPVVKSAVDGGQILELKQHTGPSVLIFSFSHNLPVILAVQYVLRLSPGWPPTWKPISLGI